MGHFRLMGKRWTEAEDALIREAAEATRQEGLWGGNTHWSRTRSPYVHERRLADVAARLGRTYEATRKRAQRIGARSYVP